MQPEMLTKTPVVEPRPYQVRIVTRAIEGFQQKGLRSIMIESPTGSGKTIMGLLIAKQMQKLHGLRIGWVAMRRHLLAQARTENAIRGIHADLSLISMFDKDPPRPLDMLIVDEAQHDAAGSMAHLHNQIRPRFILGLSATPFRADRVKLCFDTVLRDASIHRLIQDGYLSPYHHYTIPEYSPAAIADCYCREPSRWGKSILYFHTLQQCHASAGLLLSRGVRCAVVSGDSDREVLAAIRKCATLGAPWAGFCAWLMAGSGALRRAKRRLEPAARVAAKCAPGAPAHAHATMRWAGRMAASGVETVGAGARWGKAVASRGKLRMAATGQVSCRG